jgi:hypothetical protein
VKRTGWVLITWCSIALGACGEGVTLEGDRDVLAPTSSRGSPSDVPPAHGSRPRTRGAAHAPVSLATTPDVSDAPAGGAAEGRIGQEHFGGRPTGPQASPPDAGTRHCGTTAPSRAEPPLLREARWSPSLHSYDPEAASPDAVSEGETRSREGPLTAPHWSFETGSATPSVASVAGWMWESEGLRLYSTWPEPETQRIVMAVSDTMRRLREDWDVVVPVGRHVGSLYAYDSPESLASIHGRHRRILHPLLDRHAQWYQEGKLAFHVEQPYTAATAGGYATRLVLRSLYEDGTDNLAIGSRGLAFADAMSDMPLGFQWGLPAACELTRERPELRDHVHTPQCVYGAVAAVSGILAEDGCPIERWDRLAKSGGSWFHEACFRFLRDRGTKETRRAFLGEAMTGRPISPSVRIDLREFVDWSESPVRTH